MPESGKVEDLLDLLVDLANEPKSNSSSEELQESEPDTKPELVDKSEKIDIIDKLDRVEKIDEVNRIEKLDKVDTIEQLNTIEKINRDDSVKALEQLHDLVGDLVRPEKRDPAGICEERAQRHEGIVFVR